MDSEIGVLDTRDITGSASLFQCYCGDSDCNLIACLALLYFPYLMRVLDSKLHHLCDNIVSSFVSAMKCNVLYF